MSRASLQLFGRIVLITILVVLAVWLLRRFLPALAWAAVLAIATWPVREWLTDKGMKRSNAAISLTFVFADLGSVSISRSFRFRRQSRFAFQGMFPRIGFKMGGLLRTQQWEARQCPSFAD
jgi:hypothetical protein